MASVTVDSSSAGTVTEGPPLQAESIATVDLRLLSQSELYSLSLCSPAAFNPRCDDDVIIPKIDRSVFNESAGSRKQTYSRLRLAPAAAASSSSSALRSRTPHLRQPLHNPSFTNDPENSQIVNLLKQLFGSGTSSETNPLDLVPIRVDFSHSVPVPVPESGNVGLIGQKRGRGRPRKNESAEMAVLKPRKIEVADMGVLRDIVVYQNVDDTRDKEMLNRDGEQVDLAVLGALGDPFGEELRRRTEGMRSEEELLRFMARTNGQWGSTRKKKRIVDASEFGNALPKGWKLLLSVKKKEGRVWLHCRRYISPNGRRFDTCKEISSYLLFLQGERSENLPTHAKGSETVETSNNCVLASTSDLRVQDGRENGSPPSPAVCPEEVQGLLNLGELSEVQVGDLFHCDKCNVTFDGKEDLLQHQLSCHRRRKSRNGQSITDGVIIKEGKFECQFCHKTFEERHRYNGHIGAHIKNQVKPADGSSLPINIGECVEPVVSSGPVLIESTFQNSAVSPTENADVIVGAGCNPVPACKIEEDHIETDNKLEGPSEAMVEETCADVSNKTEEPKQEAILCSNGVVDSCCIGVDDGSFPPKMDGSKAESDRFVESESTAVLCSDTGVLDENSLSSAKQVLLGPSGKNINVVDSISSLAATSKDDRDLNDNNLTTLNEHSCLFPHLDKRENTAERDASNISTCFIEEEPHQEKGNEGRLSLTCDKNSGVEVNDEQRSASVLFSSTDARKASSAEEYNRSYHPNLLNESKFGGSENTGHHDLNAVFGNSQMDDLGAKPNSTHHNAYVTEQTYETDKQGVGIDLSDPAIKGKMVDMESTFDMVFHSQLWDVRKVDGVGESGKKIISGFNCGDANPNEDIMAGGLWRTGFENVMPGGPADNSTSVVQSSNCFQSFDVMSDKVQDLFGENEKYDGNTGFDGLRSDRSEPVEYSFMTTQSLTSLQEEPRVLPSFDMDIEQGFNSSFWLGKDDLMPNIGGRNQVTSSVCVWCRNEFYQEPNQLGAEAGSIGSMCPSCSGRISGQFSFL